jgi:hypothetical protein
VNFLEERERDLKKMNTQEEIIGFFTFPDRKIELIGLINIDILIAILVQILDKNLT